MSFSIEFADEQQQYEARIKVIGVGGSGGNAVNTMINFGLEGVEFIVVNTDAQALNASAAPTKLPIGSTVTRGLGAGADPERGRKAALEDVQRIKELISGADMVSMTNGAPSGFSTQAFTANGWFVGGGVETTVDLFGKGWFWRNEYRYASYGNKTATDSIGGVPIVDIAFKPTVQTVTSQVVFKFN